ncbi:glycosyltransferase involved in cell wall biosynthesis [Propionibacteriaceae bacterium ES.041]|uniref:Glycosyltransferase family 4 protein n=1 Tax=Enemella evansiae TaxID=2016499 RepID=A0A255GAM6_9ACTN|nr:glycosyltransferase [Enemella evansiae]OYO12968.1 hypothetical protein CGZ94_13895 [Enemella evansiae]OYO19660.1 hypothetical protein BI335_03865 [Enemella evansiae]PFG65581.1 glycosyltransferase involved in cell wall biosynthesis [Propionibacteriaceae bacterium ES.041]
MRPLRIAVLGPYRYPLRQPAPGGLEGHVMDQVRLLRARGHEVLLVAPHGSEQLDPRYPELAFTPLRWPVGADRSDDRLPAGGLLRQEAVYARAMRALAAIRPRVDVLHNHSLSGAPLRLAGRLGLPMITTLHTPVLPEMLAGLHAARPRQSRARQAFFSVSEHTRASWARAGVTSRVLLNGVDTTLWRPGPGGTGLVWSGRIVPEKAPHLAVAAARRAGLPLQLAGRIGAPRYFERVLRPALGDGIEYVGERSAIELVELVGGSRCALVTPGWEEPFGLVLPEALACGTPVAAFARGGLRETGERTPAVRLVPADDVAALADAARDLAADPSLRGIARRTAEQRFSVARRIDLLERCYAELAGVTAGRWSDSRSMIDQLASEVAEESA